MKNALPFSVFKRSNRVYFTVSFKDETTGKYSKPISTNQSTKKEAIKTAWEWYTTGIPQKDEKLSIEKLHMFETLKSNDFTAKEVQQIITILKTKGMVKSAVIVGTKKDIQLDTFLLQFWDFDNSLYIQEKLRKKHSIHRNYCKDSLTCVKNHWNIFFTGRNLGSLTRNDIDVFIEHLNSTHISYSTKNRIIKAGTIAFKWAYQKELIEQDIFSGIVYYSGTAKERQILTPELSKALFKIDWDNKHAKLANKLSMVTGLRAGEIQALQIQDLGNNCLYIRHSWNAIDGLKVPKNKESRIVQLPFPDIINELIELSKENPHGVNMDSFIFWGLLPNKPIDEKVFIKYLRRSLQQIGLSEAESKKSTFHSWRHFFTTFMKERVTDKILQQQTGHKTLAMLEHYSKHKTQTDIIQLQTAQIEVFSDILTPQNSQAKTDP